MNDTEENILYRAIERFELITGFKAAIVNNKRRGAYLVSATNNDRPDAELVIKCGKETYKFVVEVKPELRVAVHSSILNYHERWQSKFLLVGNYLPKPVKDNLKAQNINYLDAAGNCFINSDGLFLFVNDQAVTPVRQRFGGRLWRPAGMRFLFPLLLNPELLNASYRELAKASGVALGNIGGYMEELRKEGYVIEGAEKMLWENRNGLRQQWINHYASILRPQLVMGCFRFPPAKDWSMLEEARPKHFFWGGEPAAALLTGYLNPGRFTVYTASDKVSVMKELRLLPDPEGSVEMLKMFWNADALAQATVKGTVPPLLVYAELVSSTDSRNREVAQRLQKQFDL